MCEDGTSVPILDAGVVFFNLSEDGADLFAVFI